MIGLKLSVAAALSVVLLTGAHAAPVTYDIDFTIPGFDSTNPPPTGLDLSVTGTITTDGNIGSLNTTDISSANVIFNGKTLNEINLFDPYDDHSFQAGANGSLTFSFINTSSSNPDRLTFESPFGNQEVQLFSQGGDNFASVFDFDAISSSSVSAFSNSLPQGTILTIGTTAVSSVPLPASAPMFGAALVAFGVAGYGMKRNRSKTAVSGQSSLAV